MNASQDTHCPTDAVLIEFGLGKLDAASTERISRHIETCANCRQRVAGLSGDTFVRRLQQAGGVQPRPRERTFVPGESLANAANSTDGSTSLGNRPRLPEASSSQTADQSNRGRSLYDVSAPPELANHPDYELIKQLGQGGMGTVYLAKNRMMDRMEVLKVISQAVLDKPGARERFLREIQSAASLHHANIVAAYSVFRLGDSLVFAMEYVKGQDLEKVVAGRGYLPVANAAFYIHQVALGLQHAHEKGLVHRDIKPNNLMLAIEGKKHTVKILDFGLAKATSEKSTEAGLTKSGQMLGTPLFVAPEQTLDAHTADIRADIYSLGCTLYYLLSGHPPFEEQSLYALLEAHHKRDARPLNLVRPEVPVELAAVVAKMMAKDATKRYQTPGDVAKALVPFFKPGQSLAVALPTDASRTAPPGETFHSLSTATPAVAATPPPPLLAPVPVASPISVATSEPADLLGVSIDTHRPAKKRRADWRSLPPWQRWTALAGAAAVFLLGVVFLIHTPKGTIKIVLSDHDADVKVTVDGDRIDIAGLEKPLSLEVGEHRFKVIGDGFNTITDRFEVTRGANQPLVIQLVPALPPDGFVPLFNGKDLTGWKTHPKRPGNWGVENGVLIGSGPASHLYTERGNYTNFHLRVEARINDGGNSGIYGGASFGPARPPENPMFPDGYEAQINSTVPGPKTGSLYAAHATVQQNRSVSVGPREWFTLELIADDNLITVKVNGQMTTTYTDANRRFPMGHIALQQHDPQTVVEFRKIEIKELRSGALARPAVVPTDAEIFGGHWYRFYPEQLNWKEARDRCQSLGGHLVVIDSLPENAFVGGLVEKAAWQDAWIGATDEAEEGRWRDVNGELLHFTNWLTLGPSKPGNQPNNKNNEEHYVVISNRTVGGAAIDWRWSDQPNESKQHQPGFVCEWEPRSASSPTATEAANDDGWMPLFNGKDLTGWKPVVDEPGVWRVENGVLIGSGGTQNGSGILRTQREDFTDFHLRVEARITDGGYAGVNFHTGFEPDATGQSRKGGYHAVINSTNGNANKTGSLGIPGRGPVVSVSQAAAPHNRWFGLEVISIANRILIKIDGRTTVNYLDSPQRFDHGGFAVLQTGPPAVIEFRKIEVNLAPSAAANAEISKPPDSAELAAARPYSVRASADPADFPDIVGEVAPGFTMAPSGSPKGVAILGEHFGRKRVLLTHPPGREQSCILTRTLDVPASKETRLLIDVSHHPAGDWRLVVKANGQQLYGGIVGPTTAKGGWLRESIDLTPFAGKQVAIELENQPTGWTWEFGYWGRVELTSTASETLDTQASAATTNAASPKPEDQAARPSASQPASRFTATEAFSLRQHTAGVSRVAFHRGMPLLASAGKDGRVLLWNLETRSAPLELAKFRVEVWAMKFSPDAPVLAYANRNWQFGSALILKTFAGVDVKFPVSPFKRDGGAVASMAYSPDGRLLATGQDDGSIRLWDVGMLKEIPPVSLGHNIFGLAFGPVTSDRRLKQTSYLLAAACQDGTVKTLTATFSQSKKDKQWTFAPTAVQFANGGFAVAVRFSPDGKLLAYSRGGGHVGLCDPRTGAEVRALASGRYGVHMVEWIAFHPQRPWCLTSHDEERVARIWNTDTAELLCELQGHAGSVHCAEFSPDGRRVATSSEDFSIKVWELSGADVPVAMKSGKKAKLPPLIVGD